MRCSCNGASGLRATESSKRAELRRRRRPRRSMPTPAESRPGDPDLFAAKLRAVLAGWASLPPPSGVTVAFSGGLDSTVLLATLCRLDLPARIRAAHVDHGLHPR